MGNAVLLANLVSAGTFTEKGLTWAAIQKGDDLVYGFISTKGEWKIKPGYSGVYDFDGDIPRVEISYRTLYVDMIGKEIPEPE